MTSAHLIGRPQQAFAVSPEVKWIAAALVVAAITFNAVLCLINTHVTPVNNSYVIGSEALIITIALLTCYSIADPEYTTTIPICITSVIAYTILLSFLRSFLSYGEGMDLKVVRDFSIPVIFFLLGKSLNDIKTADTIVYATTGIVVLFALFEYYFLDDYLNVFGVTEYYVARGTLDASDPSLQWAGGLMMSGIRPPEQGRELLPFLGDHRVSSLFLEPIGLGNFGCLVALWGIVRSRMERRLRFWSVAAGITLIILSDTRFNAWFLGVGVLILLVSPRVTTPTVLAMPFLLIVGLYLGSANVEVHDSLLGPEGLSMKDRLLYSGRVLLDFDLYNWLGIETSRAETLDAGYAYVISSLGLLGFTAFWFWLVSLRGHNRYFRAFRNASAAYFAALLTVSASQFTIKTAALLWFLMGTLFVAQSRETIMCNPRIYL